MLLITKGCNWGLQKESHRMSRTHRQWSTALLITIKKHLGMRYPLRLKIYSTIRSEEIVSRQISSPISSQTLLIHDSILLPANKCSLINNIHGTGEELLAFIGLQWTRGSHGRRNSVEFLWSTPFGPRYFQDAMSRYKCCCWKRSFNFMKRGIVLTD